MSCELYISLTASDFIDEQVHIQWALSYFKGGHVASFAKCILWQELRSGKMCFASWSDFTKEFVSAFCPENEAATTALMRLKSDRYFQGKQNVEAYIDEFKDLVDLSGYTDPVRGHPPVSLLLLSSPTFYLCIGIPPPHLGTLSKDQTYSR
jgi:hypothetical protein